MLTESDLKQIQDQEDYCISLAEGIAKGVNVFGLNIAIAGLITLTKQKLYKPQILQQESNLQIHL